MPAADRTWTPVELMYMYTGAVGLSYCRYSSSASISSVTAGTSDMPCGAARARGDVQTLNRQRHCDRQRRASSPGRLRIHARDCHTIRRPPVLQSGRLLPLQKTVP